MRPFFGRIGLFTLHFGKLTNPMFLARDAKQQGTKRKSGYALPGEESHNALAHLSASHLPCKIKAL
jgi:hypothetical protein